jgi:hypothetical protein
MAGNDINVARFESPKRVSKQAWFSRYIEKSLQPWSRCLFWVAEWGIWPSSENWHLYYRLRQGYDDYRLIEEAPAHLFLNYEDNDLASFLQVGLNSGWDMFLGTDENYSRVFIPHDEWIEFGTRDAAALDELTADLLQSDIKSLTATSASAR